MNPDKRTTSKSRHLVNVSRVVLFLFAIYIVVLMTVAVVKVFQVSNQVQGQTTFIVNYLRCIGQTPQDRRGPKATNVCFDKYAPKENVKR